MRKSHDWRAAPGVRQDSDLWTHLISGGFKVAYQRDRLGINLRAGVNHRTTSDDLPGYANRAVAPGVVHFSHRANMDRTVGAVGAGASYAINKHAIVGISYDGMFGKDTSAHIGSLSFAFPF
ncbi:MAG: autotransporter outer membrane beta-barrel domain-containing protein [Planctomycetaceae bacterium]|nr:autotransporter outer membrane beta-barrel domain-containing protein [Planctomycetaceae bacterium]